MYVPRYVQLHTTHTYSTYSTHSHLCSVSKVRRHKKGEKRKLDNRGISHTHTRAHCIKITEPNLKEEKSLSFHLVAIHFVPCFSFLFLFSFFFESSLFVSYSSRRRARCCSSSCRWSGRRPGSEPGLGEGLVLTWLALACISSASHTSASAPLDWLQM